MAKKLESYPDHAMAGTSTLAVDYGCQSSCLISTTRHQARMGSEQMTVQDLSFRFRRQNKDIVSTFLLSMLHRTSTDNTHTHTQDVEPTNQPTNQPNNIQGLKSRAAIIDPTSSTALNTVIAHTPGDCRPPPHPLPHKRKKPKHAADQTI